jgi:hypothetical protein
MFQQKNSESMEFKNVEKKERRPIVQMSPKTMVIGVAIFS